MIPLTDDHQVFRCGTVPARRRMLALLLAIAFFGHHGALAAEATPEELEQAKQVLAERMRRHPSVDLDPEVTGSVARSPDLVQDEALGRLFAPQPLGPENRFVPGPTGSIPDAP